MNYAIPMPPASAIRLSNHNDGEIGVIAAFFAALYASNRTAAEEYMHPGATYYVSSEGYLLRDDEGKEIFPLEFVRNTPVPVAYFEKLHPVVYTAVESLEMEIFRANDKGADEAWLVEKQEELKVLWTSIFPYLSKVDQDFLNNGGYKILEL
jgi:hypothetical protein